MYSSKTFGKKIFRPSKWSHILNYWLQYDFEENDSRGRSNNDYELDLDSSLKFGDLVLENRFELIDDICRLGIIFERILLKIGQFGSNNFFHGKVNQQRF